MDFLTVVIILIVGFFLLMVWRFSKYKMKEKKNKNEIYSYLSEGLPLSKAIEMSFSNLNRRQNLGLDTFTISNVSMGMADMIRIMDIDNVVEIYSMFIHNYIFKGDVGKKPIKISGEKILYALENLNLQEKNGYFVIGPDKKEDWDKKYPV